MVACASKSFAIDLLAWYDRAQRKLPWRSVSPDPWKVLVSELMLQQTQVKTVIPYFLKFLRAFPTPAHLARADEQTVLRHWQGLGYYRRAGYLHRAARDITGRFNGQFPRNLDELLSLPGVGKYTAGAVASIAFGIRAPLVDGNVARVLARLDARRKFPGLPAEQRYLWKRAAQILPKDRVGEFNSALMELGATICIARKPKCEICPVKKYCCAFAESLQDRIPPPRPARQNPENRRWTIVIERAGEFLIERRPDDGRWAGMWQFLTLPAEKHRPTSAWLRKRNGLSISKVKSLFEFHHQLTHRRYHFSVYTAELCAGGSEMLRGSSFKWATLRELNKLPMPVPHLKIVRMLVGRRI